MFEREYKRHPFNQHVKVLKNNKKWKTLEERIKTKTVKLNNFFTILWTLLKLKNL